MNTERPTPQEGDEQKIDWTPHALDDECAWNSFREEKKYKDPSRKQKGDVYDILVKFINTDGSPQKTLSEGEFSLRAHNVGTIVKFERNEMLTTAGFERTTTYWGIIDEARDEQNNPIRVLIYLPESKYPRDGHILAPTFLSNSTASDIGIGDIIHEKMDKGGYKGQRLERTNWFQVWQYGQEVRETSKGTEVIGRFIPKQSAI